MNDDSSVELDNNIVLVHIAAEMSQLHELLVCSAAGSRAKAVCELSTDGLLLIGVETSMWVFVMGTLG